MMFPGALEGANPSPFLPVRAGAPAGPGRADTPLLPVSWSGGAETHSALTRLLLPGSHRATTPAREAGVHHIGESYHELPPL